jgi:hypothetical protein
VGEIREGTWRGALLIPGYITTYKGIRAAVIEVKGE